MSTTTNGSHKRGGSPVLAAPLSDSNLGSADFFTDHTVPLAIGIAILLVTVSCVTFIGSQDCCASTSTAAEDVNAMLIDGAEEHDQTRRLRWLIESSHVVMGASRHAPATSRTYIVRLADGRGYELGAGDRSFQQQTNIALSEYVIGSTDDATLSC